ncbi:MAG: molybdopterin molybdotransferase MoeA [Planctomycetes bacterium]|nr:molybdopterin molybdotransferase MoeA [Planctomycetota bacterium]NUQ35846.1 molybdopterin molybdotransferase MoeA [Planctomycetaceae bacterium]
MARTPARARKETPKIIAWKLHEPHDAALQILGAIKPVTRLESVALIDAADRIVAREVKSPVTLPAYDTSERDGYAVASGDVAKVGVRLACIGEATAGAPFNGSIRRGQCVRIATGALIPKGADAVVMFEDSRASKDGRVEFSRLASKRQWIARAGHDVRKGAVILKAGDVITPAQIALASACGLGAVPVRARPKALVFTTGNEVKQPGQMLAPGDVYDGNTSAIAALLKRHNIDVTACPTVRDTEHTMTVKLRESAKRYDIIVFTGGTSVGDKDFGRRALDACGRTLVHGVNIKPGKPLLFGTVRRCLVFGLPGFPTSSLALAYHFVVPAALKLAGYEDVVEPRVEGVLTEALNPDPSKLTIVPVVIDGDGRVAGAFKGSAAISSVGMASGMVEIEAGSPPPKAGDIVAVRLF